MRPRGQPLAVTLFIGICLTATCSYGLPLPNVSGNGNSNKVHSEKAVILRQDRRVQVQRFDVDHRNIFKLLEITASSYNATDTVYHLLVSRSRTLVETSDFRIARERESATVIHLTFSTSGRIILSEFSTPKLSSGFWYIGVQIKEGNGSSDAVEIVYEYREVDSLAPMAVMCGVTIGLGIIIAVVAHFLLNADRTEFSITCKCCSLKDVICHWFAKGLKKYTYVTAAIAIVFAVGSVQYVIARWYRMVETGDRDICYYNEKCYRPVVLGDVPSNLMLSNLPYIFHGVILVLSISCRESSCLQAWNSGDRTRKIPYDFSVGYALAWTLIFEGCFSTMYHLCPTRMIFQFDSAFMFIISGLIVVALYNAHVVSHVIPHHATDLEPRWNNNCIDKNSKIANRNPNGVVGTNDDIQVPDGLLYSCAPSHTPVQAPSFFLFFAAPLLIFNYVGSLRDTLEEGLPKALEVLYWLLLVVWFVLLLVWVSRKLFSWTENKSADKKNCCCKLTWLILYVIIAVPVITWFTWGDNSHLFLFSCLAAVFFSVMGLLTYKKTKKVLWMKAFETCRTLKGICIFIFVVFTGGFLFGGVYVFLALPTTDKVKEPHESRSKNEECVILNFFDWHDLWHVLSSFALLMCTYLLLYATRKFERRMWIERNYPLIGFELKQRRRKRNVALAHTINFLRINK